MPDEGASARREASKKSNGAAIFNIDPFPQHETNNKKEEIRKKEKEIRCFFVGSDYGTRHAAGIGDGGWQRSYCARQRRKSNKDL